MKKVKTQRLFPQIARLFASRCAMLFCLLFTAVPFVAAYDGSVKFTVTIKNGGTCQVRSGYENKQVQLGTVYANELQTVEQTAGETDFDLWVEDCGDLINETNKLKFVLINTANHPQLLAKGVLPNLATGTNQHSVGVQLLTANRTPISVKYNLLGFPTNDIEPSANGHTLGAERWQGKTMPLKARFYAITEGKNDKAGNVRAEVIFAAFYE